MTIPASNPLGYTGVKEKNPPNVFTFKRDPTAGDITSFDIGDIWINTVSLISWQLVSKASGVATWTTIGGGGAQISQLTGDDALTITPTAGNINILGGNGLNTAMSAPSTMVVQNLATLTPDVGAAVIFQAGNINLIGTAAQGITSSRSAGTIKFTVQDASTAVKGVSTYSADEFNVAAGSVSLHGGLVLISSQTANNSPSILFNNIGTYKNYLLVINNATPSTNGEELFMQVSQDNGVTWIGAAHYQSGLNYSNYNSAVLTNKNANDSFYIAGAIENSNECDAIVYIQNVNMPDYIGIHGSSVWYDQVSGLTAYATFGGRSTTGINAFLLTMTTNNIDTGTFTLYGIKNT